MPRYPQALPKRRVPAARTVLAALLVVIATLAVGRAQAGKTPLTVTITSAPSGQTTSTSASVSFTTTGARKTDCHIDSKGWSKCTSPVSYTGLAVGTHTVYVRATAGDGSRVTATASWQVVSSTTPPPPSGFAVGSSIAGGSTLTGSLTWEAKPSQSVSKVQFYVDGSLKWTENYSPYIFNGDGNKLDTTTIPDGNHVLKAVATTSTGTTGEVSANVLVANNSSTTTPPPPPAPTFTVTSSITDGSTLSGSLVWTASPNQSVTKVEFFIDGSLRWTEAASPYRFNGDTGSLDTTTLSNGSHTLRVLATASGGTAETSATVTVSNTAAAPPPPPPTTTGAASAGHIQFMEKTSPSTDQYTNSPTTTQQQWFRDHWQRAIVYTSYWDSKTSWYPNAWVYQDAYAIYNPSTLAGQHPEWILKDASGNKLYIPFACSGGTCPQYAADIGSPGWRQYFIDRCKALIAKGYKGIHVDDVDMDINVGNGSGQDVAPIDPRTGQLMTDTQWKAYFAEFMEQLRAALPGVEIAHNAVWFSGGGLHDGTNPYIQREIKAANIINLERGFNDGGLTGGTGTWSVFALMRFIDNVHSYGAHVVIQSYATDTTSAEYNLAGYFLINDGNDYVATTGLGLPGNWWSGYDMDLGDATSGRYLWNGVWRRDFTGGMVLMNEPGATTKTITLGGSFTNTSGQTVSSVTLGAARGAVLKTA